MGRASLASGYPTQILPSPTQIVTVHSAQQRNAILSQPVQFKGKMRHHEQTCNAMVASRKGFEPLTYGLGISRKRFPLSSLHFREPLISNKYDRLIFPLASALWRDLFWKCLPSAYRKGLPCHEDVSPSGPLIPSLVHQVKIESSSGMRPLLDLASPPSPRARRRTSSNIAKEADRDVLLWANTAG